MLQTATTQAPFAAINLQNLAKQRENKQATFSAIIQDNWEACKNRFRVTFTNGTTEIKRLFTNSGMVCEYGKGRRTYGHYAYIDNWQSLEPVKAAPKYSYTMFHRNTTKAAALLAASGLWPDMQKRMEVMSKMTEAEYNALLDIYEKCWDYTSMSEEQRNTMRQAFDSFFTSRGVSGDFYHFKQLSEKSQIISIPFGKDGNYERRMVANHLEQAQQSAADYDDGFGVRWYGSYDYSVSVSKKDGVLRGWYSAEYKGCGNGHYYLLLDATHAIYGEDD